MSAVRLVDVYKTKAAISILYKLLDEREKRVRISHKKMPTLAQHRAFVRKKPYKIWYLIQEGGVCVGSIYLSKNDEIGLFIFRKYRSNLIKEIWETRTVHNKTTV